MHFTKPKTIIARYNGFTPIRELDSLDIQFPKCLETFGVSQHIIQHRTDRFNAIEVNAGIGNCVTRFLVERQGRNEIHTIFDNGIIITQMEGRDKVITFMFARPEQLKEYWIGMGNEFPQDIYYLLELADENQYLAWHN